MDMLIWSSSVGLLSLAAYWSFRRRDPRSLLWTLLMLALVLGVLSAAGAVRPPWQEADRARGESRTPLTLALYGAMLVGMLSHFLFFRLSRPQNRRGRLDLGNFLAPVFVSPIVFLPLASVFEAVEPGPAVANASRLMLFLVAFENGFFWREFFENRRQAWAEGSAK